MFVPPWQCLGRQVVLLLTWCPQRLRLSPGPVQKLNWQLDFSVSACCVSWGSGEPSQQGDRMFVMLDVCYDVMFVHLRHNTPNTGWKQTHIHIEIYTKHPNTKTIQNPINQWIESTIQLKLLLWAIIPVYRSCLSSFTKKKTIHSRFFFLTSFPVSSKQSHTCKPLLWVSSHHKAKQGSEPS